MKKWVWGIAVIAVVLGGVWLARQHKTELVTAQNEKPVVKIGVVTQLSGNMAMVGEGIKNAVALAQEDLKSRPMKYRYEFVVEDDAFEARKTAMIVSKLINLDKVDAILSSFSQTGKIVSPQAEKAGILHISISSDPGASEGRYNFLDWTMPKNTAGRMLKFFKDKGFRKIVTIVPNNSGALPLEKAFIEQIKPEDGLTVQRNLVAPEEKDFKMLLAQASQEEPDVYLNLLYGSSFVPFFRQYNETGETALVASIETFAVIPDFSIADGAYFTDAAEADAEFLRRYEARFGKASSYGSGNMYDMVMLTVAAFEKAESKSKAVDELEKITTYDGVIGRLTQEKNGIFNSDAVLKKIVNGKPVIVEE